MKFLISVVVFLLIDLLIMGCSKPQQPEYQGFDHLRVSPNGGSESVVSAQLKFYNPNNFPMQLRKADVYISLNDKQAAHCLIDSVIQIPARSNFLIPASVNIRLNSIFSNLLQLLVNQKTKINVDGLVKMKKSGLGFTIPVHYESYQNIDAFLHANQ